MAQMGISVEGCLSRVCRLDSRRRRGPRRRSATFINAIGLVLLLCQVLAVPARAEDPMSTLIAVGDIANCKKSKMERGWFEWFLESIHLKEAAETVPGATAIADQVEQLPGTILALGDLAYPEGSESNIRNCLDPLWSGLKDRTRPAIL
jgi:hypothetical protein